MEFVCLDLETTGFDFAKDQVIEFAAVKFDGGTVLDSCSALTDPGVPIPPIVRSITGIGNDDVRGLPPFSAHKKALAEFIGDRPILGHNINFDTAFLRGKGLDLNNREIDTLDLAGALLPYQESYSLESLCQSFGIEHENKHRALSDVKANIALFKILLATISDLSDKTLQTICCYLSRSNWDSRTLFFSELRSRGLTSSPFIAPHLYALAADQVEMKKSGGETADHTPPSLDRIFAPQGAMAQVFGSRYEPRAAQAKMSRLVTESFAAPHHLLCEAGTGTGKSLAYLISAALFALKEKKPVLISTHTNHLQDQLSEQDLPLLRELLAAPTLQTAILKGRDHYLSLVAFTRFLERPFFEKHEAVSIVKILIWLGRTVTGDKKELALRDKENAVWREICCQENNCPHEETGASYPCFLLKNRAAARAAHIVITNHALLLQDCLADNPVLPAAQQIIVDEAHNLEEVATKIFSETFAAETGDRILEEIRPLRASNPDLASAAQEFENAHNLAFGLLGIFLQNRLDPAAEYRNDIIINDSAQEEAAWQQAKNAFVSVAERCRRLQIALADGQNQSTGNPTATAKATKITPWGSKDTPGTIKNLLRLIKLFFHQENNNLILWGNIGWNGHPYLKIAPIKVGPLLRDFFFRHKESVVLTSATLSVGHNFEYLKSQLGLESDWEEVILPSPFHYAKQCAILVVEDIPAPSEHGHFAAVCGALRNIIAAKKGRILVLLTSKNTVTAVYKELFPFCREEGVNLYAQKVSGGRGKILQNFRLQPEKSVILGLNSFWEGVDLPGDMLTTVVIQKLPFDPPSDPLLVARGNLTANPFLDYAVPRAILRFKQGFGRLIRSSADSGALIILDSRVVTKRYGQVFLSSLPEGIPLLHCRQKSLSQDLKMG